MKKTLLSLLCLLGMFFYVSAQTTATFVAASYSGSVSGTKLMNADGGDTGESNSKDKSLIDQTFTDNGLTITFSSGSSGTNYTASYGNAVRFYQGAIITVTIPSGMKLTDINCCIASYSKGAFDVKNSEGTSIGTVTGAGTTANEFVTWQGEATGSVDVVASKQVRFQYIQFTYKNNSAATTVSTPAFSVPTGTEVDKGSTVSLTCETVDADIYYTTDGTEPTTSSTEYTAPIVINADVTIKAFAVKADMDDSPVVTASYTIPDPNVAKFTNWPTLFGVDQNGSNSVTANSIDWTVTVNYVTLNVKNGTSTSSYLKAEDFRVYKGYTMTFTAPENFGIVDITSEKGGLTFSTGVTADSGTVEINSSTIDWTGTITKSVVLTFTEKVSFAKIIVTIAPMGNEKAYYVGNENLSYGFLWNKDATVTILCTAKGDSYSTYTPNITFDGVVYDSFTLDHSGTLKVASRAAGTPYYNWSTTTASTFASGDVVSYNIGGTEDSYTVGAFNDDPTLVEQLFDDAEGVAEYFNLNGMRVNGDNLAKGLYIVRKNGKSVKVLVR